MSAEFIGQLLRVVLKNNVVCQGILSNFDVAQKTLSLSNVTATFNDNEQQVSKQLESWLFTVDDIASLEFVDVLGGHEKKDEGEVDTANDEVPDQQEPEKQNETDQQYELEHEHADDFIPSKPLEEESINQEILSELKLRVQNVLLIDQLSEALALVADLRKHSILAVDCEGVQLSRDGQLCLISISTTDEQVYVFDILALGSGVFNGGLRDILEDASITKIMHDCRQDSDALFYQFHVTLKNVFDTQVADTYIRRQAHPRRFLPRNVNGYSRCLQTYLHLKPEECSFKDYGRQLLRSNGNVFAQRPLSEFLLYYTAADTFFLPMLYRTMNNLMHYEFTTACELYTSITRDGPPQNSFATHRSGSQPSTNQGDSSVPANLFPDLNAHLALVTSEPTRQDRTTVPSSRSAGRGRFQQQHRRS